MVDGNLILLTAKGKLDVYFVQINRKKTFKTTMVKVAPGLTHNLFSFTTDLQNGRTMIGQKKENTIVVVF